MRVIKRLFRLCLVLVVLAGCSSESQQFPYHVIIAGGPEGWPIWAEEIKLDGAFVPGGINGRGFDKVPPIGASRIGREPSPAPQVIEARWFSYRSQKFHEVSITLPDDMNLKLLNWYEEYPSNKYRHYLLLGFSGKGEALAWWRAKCSTCGFDRSQDFSTPLIENIKAQEVSGDPAKYRSQTQQFIDEGRIPASVLQ